MTPPDDSRPHLHTAIFCDVRDEDEERRVEEIRKGLGWSTERLALFTRLVIEYRQRHSIEAYLRVRREFPEVEIQVGQFGGIEPLFALEKEFRRQGIEPDLVVGVMDVHRPSIDALSLQLLELLVARDKLPKDGPGHIEERRNAISDAMVNYLIATMLEAMDWNEEEILVPASLIVLIRHQLCGPDPDLHASYQSRQKRQDAAFAICQLLKPGEKLSVRKLAKMASISPATAARWIADAEFQSQLKQGARLLELFPLPPECLTKK